MQRISILAVTAIVLAACSPQDPPISAPSAARTAVPEIDAEPAAMLHAAALTLDTHVDIDPSFATEAIDPLDADIKVNLEKMRAGGLDAAFFIVYVRQTERTPENYAQAQTAALTKFDAIHRMTDVLYPDRIGLAYDATDVERLIAEGKLAAAIGIENGYVIGTDLELLDRYYELGARYMTLVHNGHNDIADSASPRPQFGDEPTEHRGVSELGAAVIRRMNELGIMVDISHASKEAALAAIALSQAPVIASHSSVRALADHARNLDDETLLALRDNGGVVQIVAYDAFLKVHPPERVEALRGLHERWSIDPPVDLESLDPETAAAYLAALDAIDSRWPRAAVADLVDHIVHAVELIGIDHVGISSDFGGGGGIDGWDDAGETPNVTAELLGRGFSAEDIGKLWSGNLLRVWREVEDVAAQRQR